MPNARFQPGARSVPLYLAVRDIPVRQILEDLNLPVTERGDFAHIPRCGSQRLMRRSLRLVETMALSPKEVKALSSELWLS